MALAFTRISLWLWGSSGPKDDLAGGSGSNNNNGGGTGAGNMTHTLSSSFDFGLGFREPETNFRLSSRQRPPSSSTARKSRRKWQSREERRRVHSEEDVVVVPSDGGCCLSGSESDDSDWSIGWLEPHAPDFLSDAEDVDASFAVLVPCYGRGRGGGNPGATAAGAVDYGPGFRGHDDYNSHPRNFFPSIDLTNSSETRKYMEDLLSALQAST